MKKRVLSSILALVLVLSLFSSAGLSVFADETTLPEGGESTSSVSENEPVALSEGGEEESESTPAAQSESEATPTAPEGEEGETTPTLPVVQSEGEATPAAPEGGESEGDPVVLSAEAQAFVDGVNAIDETAQNNMKDLIAAWVAAGKPAEGATTDAMNAAVAPITQLMDAFDALPYSEQNIEAVTDAYDALSVVLATMLTAMDEEPIVPMENGSGYGVVLASSQINGTNFVNTGNSANVAIGVDVVSGNVVVKFPEGTTDGRVEITIPKGLQWSQAGDMNGFGTVTSPTDNHMGYPGDTQFNPPKTMGDGTNVYTVNPGTVNFSIADLKISQNFYYQKRHMTGKRIEVKVYYGGALQDTAYIDDIDLTNDREPMGFTQSNMDQYVALDTTLFYGPSYTVNGGVGVYVDQFDVKFTASYVYGPTCDPTKFEMTDTKAGDSWTLSAKDSLDGSYTLSTSNFFLNPLDQGGYSFSFPSSDFQVGDRIKIQVDFTGKFMDGVDIVPKSTYFYVTILPTGVDLFTNFYSIGNALDGKQNGLDSNLYPFFASHGNNPGASGELGVYFIGNRGGTDSGPERIELQFDDTKIGVRTVSLCWPQQDITGDGITDITVTNVKYTTNMNAERSYTGTVQRYSGYYVQDLAYLTPDMLGLVDGEYITDISYEVSNIPAGACVSGNNVTSFSLWQAAFYGDIISLNDTAYTDVIIKDPNSNAVMAQSQAVTKTSAKNGAAYPSLAQKDAYKEIIAGTTQTVKADITTHPFVYGSTSNPVIYLRNPAPDLEFDINSIKLYDKAGNLIPVASAADVAAGGTALNGKLVVTTQTPDAGASQVIKIDTANITDGSVTINGRNGSEDVVVDPNLGSVAITPALKLEWDIVTNLSTTSETYKFQDCIFVLNPEATQFANWTDSFNEAYCAFSTSTLYAVMGVERPYSDYDADEWSVNKTGAGIITGMPRAADTYFAVKGRTDVIVNDEIKYVTDPDSAYTDYANNGTILVSDTENEFTVRTSFINYTGTAGEIKNMILYMPIPKEGENWGLSSNSEAFKFSTKLTSPVVDTTGLYDITYANTTPVVIAGLTGGTELNGRTFEAYNSANAASYNCIKIKLKDGTTIPYITSAQAGGATGDALQEANTDHFTYTIAIDDPNATDGLVDLFQPRYYEDYTGNSLPYSFWENGILLGIETALGQIKGTLWLDSNVNGVLDTAETTVYANKTVELYEQISKTTYDALPTADQANYTLAEGKTDIYRGVTPLKTDTTDTNGGYFFDLLDRTKDYIIMAPNSNAGTGLITVIGNDTDPMLNNKFVTTDTGNTKGILFDAKAVRNVNDTAAGGVNAAHLGIYPMGVTPGQLKVEYVVQGDPTYGIPSDSVTPPTVTGLANPTASYPLAGLPTTSWTSSDGTTTGVPGHWELQYSGGTTATAWSPTTGVATGIANNTLTNLTTDTTVYAQWKFIPVDYSLKIIKENGDGTKLANAGFKVYTDENCSTLATVYTDAEKTTALTGAVNAVTNASGILNLYGFVPGTYYLKEVATPTGYTLLSTPAKIVVAADGTVKVNDVDATPAGTSTEITVTVTNTAVVLDIPTTGFGGIAPFIVIPMAAMLAAFGGFMFLQKKRKRI